MWTGKINVTSLELEISMWLAAHHNIVVREIRHNHFSGFWPSQLIVTIYYTT